MVLLPILLMQGAIAFKILQNAASINSGDKESRFGNLFVGLKEMNSNLDQKLGVA